MSMSCLGGGGPNATLSPPLQRRRSGGQPQGSNNAGMGDDEERLSVQPLEVAAHWLQRRALTRARRTLTAVGARFVIGAPPPTPAAAVAAPPGALPPPPRRLVHLGRDEQEDEVENVSNRISTAKYNVVTFLPLFLFSMVRPCVRACVRAFVRRRVTRVADSSSTTAHARACHPPVYAS